MRVAQGYERVLDDEAVAVAAHAGQRRVLEGGALLGTAGLGCAVLTEQRRYQP